TLARELHEPHGLAHALFFAAVLHQLRREARMAQDYAEAVLALSSEHGLVMYKAHATMTRGWALVEQGRREEGIEQMRQGLAASRAAHIQLSHPHFRTLLAEALGKARKAEEGLHELKESAEAARLSGDEYYLAEVYRIKGELL